MTGVLQLRQQLSELTENCESYELAQANREQDMNRMDAKFLLPTEAAITLCGRLLGCRDCLQVAGSHVLGYDTLYFDTPNFEFYRHHHQNKPRRLKVRERRYRETGTRFLEVKYKDKVGKTHKARIQLSPKDTIQQHSAFLSENGVSNKDLIETLRVTYERVSLRDRLTGERVSFDFCIAFHGGNHRVNVDDMAIVELKVPAHVHLSKTFSAIKAMGFRETSVSKYCVGMARLYCNQVKYNRFKPVLKRLGLLADMRTTQSELSKRGLQQPIISPLNGLGGQ